MTTLVGVRRALTGGGSIPRPSFSLPFFDLGAGAVNTAPSAGTGGSTFTRATSGTCWGSTGLLLTPGSGTARSSYTPLTGGTYRGLYSENAATNLCLQNRDMSNAAWTKTTCTAAKDQTGIDGAANAASSLTATAGAASCLQTITEAATTSVFSVYVKRITGTGTITIQQTGTTTDITALINSSTYSLVTVSASILNPVIGFNIATNGDKIAVDYCQFENGAMATSPILTGAGTVTRNVDVLTLPTAGNVVGTVGTFAAEIFVPFANSAANEYAADLASSRPPAFVSQAGNLSMADGTGTLTGPACSAGVTHKIASTWNGTSAFVYVDGVNNGVLAFDGDMNVGGNMTIGGNGGTTQRLSGFIKNVRFWQVALTANQIAIL